MARLIIVKGEIGEDHVELRDVLLPDGAKRDYAETGRGAFLAILNQIAADRFIARMAMRLGGRMPLALPQGGGAA